MLLFRVTDAKVGNEFPSGWNRKRPVYFGWIED
jgi:hypothetical protein